MIDAEVHKSVQNLFEDSIRIDLGAMSASEMHRRANAYLLSLKTFVRPLSGEPLKILFAMKAVRDIGLFFRFRQYCLLHAERRAYEQGPPFRTGMNAHERNNNIKGHECGLRL